MRVEWFFDTNIFVYHVDASDPRKNTVAHELIRESIVRDNAVISYQVVQEWLNVVTKKASVALPTIQAQAYAERFLIPIFRVNASASLFREGLEIKSQYKLSFYDAMIVAAALCAGCKRLYSEDLQHGQKMGQLEIVNPFA